MKSKGRPQYVRHLRTQLVNAVLHELAKHTRLGRMLRPRPRLQLRGWVFNYGSDYDS